MSRGEADRVAQFAESGFTIFEAAIEPELIDALCTDVRRIAEHPGCFVTTDHRNGRSYAYSTESFDRFESAFDLYVNFETARRVCFHPTIVRFLALLFDAAPLAFQQLLFQRSNQHPIHQDTAYVCLEDPLQMAATWIALEDVVPGRGELTYYEGSHRIPHCFFRDGSKRFSPGVDDEQAMRRHILTEAERLGCAKRDFIAKKGDVLFWIADLAHGSNPRTRPEEETRMALVTHYCPTSTRPFYFRFLPENRGIQPYDGVAHMASYYYSLPAHGMVRPNFRIT
jgi:ectoine hydroxylase-related dioxygenase (phytanoyl-CoA dioxygenase family)